MRKIIYFICLLTICSCQTNSQTPSKLIIEEVLINASQYDDDKALKRNFDYEKVKNDTITIKLSQEEYTFISNDGTPYDENRVNYSMDILDSRYSLIEVKEYEDNYYLLVDRELKMLDTLPSYPFFSKNKKAIFVANLNPYETYKEFTPPTEDIYIYIYRKNKLIKIFDKPYQFYSDTFLENFYWKDENTVNLKFVDESNKKPPKFISLKIKNP